MNNYKGEIIEESINNKSVFQKLTILSTRIERVTSKHKTPWLKKWTLHTFEVKAEDADDFARIFSLSIDKSHRSSWYVDFKNNKFHYIIFPQKIFKVDLKNPFLYRKAEEYGTTLGIPKYQMEFEKLKR